MVDAVLTLARNVFQQKYRELLKFRNGLRAKKNGARPASDFKKLREYQKLVAELGKNYRKANKLIQEIQKLALRKKSNK
jgi:hypothetical protein